MLNDEITETALSGVSSGAPPSRVHVSLTAGLSFVASSYFAKFLPLLNSAFCCRICLSKLLPTRQTSDDKLTDKQRGFASIDDVLLACGIRGFF